MSHNTDPEKATRRHPVPIFVIAAVLVVAAVAAFMFAGADPEEVGDVSRIEAGATDEGATDETAADAGAADAAAGQ